MLDKLKFEFGFNNLSTLVPNALSDLQARLSNLGAKFLGFFATQLNKCLSNFHSLREHTPTYIEPLVVDAFLAITLTKETTLGSSGLHVRIQKAVSRSYKSSPIGRSNFILFYWSRSFRLSMMSRCIVRHWAFCTPLG